MKCFIFLPELEQNFANMTNSYYICDSCKNKYNEY